MIAALWIGMTASFFSGWYTYSVLKACKGVRRNSVVGDAWFISGLVALPLLFVVIYAREGWSPSFFSFGYLFSILLICTTVDLRHGIIPNGLIIISMIYAMVWLLLTSEQHLLWAVVPGIICAVVLLFFRYFGLVLAGRPGFGMGDIKLFLIIGLLIGWQSFIILYLACLFVVMVAGIAVAGGMADTEKINIKEEIPFAPWIGLAALFDYLLLQGWYMEYLQAVLH